MARQVHPKKTTSSDSALQTGESTPTSISWTSIIDQPSTIRTDPFLNPNTPADAKDIFHAFNVLAREFYSPVNKQVLGLNILVFIVVFIGNFPGAQYAENFAKTFSEKVFGLEEGPGLDFTEYYTATDYMLANLSISQISALKTIDEIAKFCRGNEGYRKWMKHNLLYLGLEKAQALASILLAGLACFALIAQNKDPDATTSAASYYYSLICQYVAVGTSASLFTRSFAMLFKKYCPDFNALVTGNLEDRENVYAAKLFVLEKLAATPTEKIKISLPMVAQGYNNKLTPITDPLASAVAVYTLYNYIYTNYFLSAEAETQNPIARKLAHVAAFAALAVCANAGAGIVNSVVDKVHSWTTKTAKVHHASDSSLLVLGTQGVVFAAPSIAAAAGRFAEYSRNPLLTKADALKAYVGALPAITINWGDINRVGSVLRKKSAELAPAYFKNWAHNTKFGASLEEFLCNVMREASSDAFIRKLFKPVPDPDAAFRGDNPKASEQMQTVLSSSDDTTQDDVPLLNNEPITIVIPKKGYPSASILGLGISFFRPKDGIQNFEVQAKGIQFLNILKLFECAKQNGYNLDQFYEQHWLKSPLAKPEDIELNDIPLLTIATA